MGGSQRMAVFLIGLLCLSSCPLSILAAISQPIVSFNPDGTFSFSYDTKTGGYQSQQKASDGSVSGSYGFSGADGSNLAVNYGAAGSVGGSGSSSGIPQAPPSSGFGGGSPGGTGSLALNLNPDGSYTYNYKLSDQSKSESRDTSGKVKGAFSYKGKDGQEKSITYTADEGGFQPIGAHIPKPEDVPAAPSLQDFGIPPSSAAGGYMASAPSIASAGSAGTLTLSLQPGGIYSYDYTLSDQAKSESRNAQGKVKGKFSYKGKDGQERSLTYTADEGGFQPIGAHLPKADDVPPSPGASGFGYAPPSSPEFGASPSMSGAAGTLSLNLQPGGIYSYDYSLPDQAKSESRNAAGKVMGQFSFTDPKGGKKSIKYKADEGGFQPEGDHIPKPSEEMAAALASLGVGVSGGGAGGYSGGSAGSFSFNYDTGSQSHRQSGSGFTGSGLSSSGGAGSSDYSSAPEASFGGPSNVAFSYQAPAHSRSESRSKRQAFSFNYDAGAHSHSQSGTASATSDGAGSSAPQSATNEGESAQGGQGQVQGEYTVNAPSGSSQKVAFTADKTGYNPSVQASIAVGNGAQAPSGAAPPAPAAPQSPSQPSDDGSGGSSSVEGKYNVNDPSGSQQSVTYTAGKTGYQPTVSVNTKVGKMKRDVQGKYNVKGEGSSQETTYTAGKDGFKDTHVITITVGKKP